MPSRAASPALIYGSMANEQETPFGVLVSPMLHGRRTPPPHTHTHLSQKSLTTHRPYGPRALCGVCRLLPILKHTEYAFTAAPSRL